MAVSAGSAGEDRPVLILAAPEERLAGRIHAGLERGGVPVLSLDPRSLLGGWGLNWFPDSAAGFLEVDGDVVPLDRLRSVLVRHPVGIPRPDASGAGENFYVDHELSATLMGWLDAQPCPVINRPRPRGTHSLLLDRLRFTEGDGLEPASLMVTTDPQAVMTFFDEACARRALVSFAERDAPTSPLVGSDGAAALNAWIERGPLVVRALPQGQRVRAFVIADQVVAGALDPSATWRPYQLPGSLEEACRRRARTLGLSLAGLELVLDGARATCLDVSDLPSDDGATPELVQELAAAVGRLLAAEGSA